MASIVFTLEDGSTITTPLDTDLITIGRAEDSIVQLPSGSVSNHHATIKVRPDGCYVQDLGSRNGTRLNGAEIEEAVLADGDRIAFGDIQAVFLESEEVPQAAYVLPEPEIVRRLVEPAAPVTGIPKGSGKFQPKPKHFSRQTAQVYEGGGCMTAFVLILLFVGAFIIGLCLRHYKVTDGGVLPSDLSDHFFNKVKRIKIEMPEDDKK
jgi:hypothetical protein